jgi:DNA-directed RNA polymerase subunit RPC12/RpoP
MGPSPKQEVSPHGEGYDLPDGWEWRDLSVTCANCDATNVIHEQPQEWLDVRHPVAGNKLGVNWECTACGAKNNLGGEAPTAPDTHVVECSECSSTFAPSDVVDPTTGEWTCPVCDTGPQRDVLAHEISTGDSSQGVTA